MNAVIFDCDGTLVDSLGQALDSFNYALDKMGEARRSPEDIKQYFGMAADRIFLKVLQDEPKAVRAFDLYMDHQSERAKTTRLHSGIRSLLDQLKAEHVPMAIVTGRHARDLDVVLKPHSLNAYFTALVADSQLPKSKPAPDGILLAAKLLSVTASDTMYIGDSVVDVQAAQNAGAVAVAANWDALAREHGFPNVTPNYIADTPKQVWEFFKSKREGEYGRR